VEGNLLRDMELVESVKNDFQFAPMRESAMHITPARGVVGCRSNFKLELCLIASFDRGLWHRLAGISSFRPAWWSPRRFRCQLANS
jgi:hypothetical protein